MKRRSFVYERVQSAPENRQFVPRMSRTCLADHKHGEKSRNTPEKYHDLFMYKRLTSAPIRALPSQWQNLLIALVALAFSIDGSAATINWYNPNPNYSIARNW